WHCCGVGSAGLGAAERGAREGSFRVVDLAGGHGAHGGPRVRARHAGLERQAEARGCALSLLRWGSRAPLSPALPPHTPPPAPAPGLIDFCSCADSRFAVFGRSRALLDAHASRRSRRPRSKVRGLGCKLNLEIRPWPLTFFARLCNGWKSFVLH